MDDPITEAAQMPDAAIQLARGTDTAELPDHLVQLRETVRARYRAEFAQLYDALDRRFSQREAEWIGVIRAAAEMALMEQIAREELEPSDRRLLRQLWESLLAAG